MAIFFWGSIACAATLAYRDPGGRLLLRGEDGSSKVVAGRNGYEACFSADAQRLVYTREEDGPNRTLVLYERGRGRSRDLVHGLVRQGHWSPDGGRIAFLKFSEGSWQIWTMAVTEPEKASRAAPLPVMSLLGWSADGKAIIAADEVRMHWLDKSGAVRRSEQLDRIYGADFQWMSSDHFRFRPRDPDLLAVSAYYMETPKGAPVDDMDLNATVFLFDLKSGKRSLVLNAKMWGHDAEWSPDGEWLYFTRLESARRRVIWRVHADGTGLERVVAGTDPALGQ